MSKRFTDTGISRQPWFRKLNPKMKCAARFLFDECDTTGVWVVDMETLSYFVGEEVTLKELFSGINSDKSNRIEMFKGDKIFIPGFISFQYGHLSEQCKPHRPILEKLKKHGLHERVLKGYQNPTETLEEKEKDKEEEKETEKEGGTGGIFLVPEMAKVFKKHIPTYLFDKNRDFKPLYSIAQFLCEQGNATGPPERHLERVLEAWDPISKFISTDKFYSQKALSTISNGIQELTIKALNGDKSIKQTASGKLDEDTLKRKLNDRFGKTG